MNAIAKDTVVSLAIELYDSEGALIQSSGEPVTYLHGGYGGLLAALEHALEGHGVGEAVKVRLEPEHAFGEYDAELLRVAPLSRYGEGLELGMEVEDRFEGAEPRLYLVTDLAGDTVVLDANHPLAGMALHFSCKVLSVRAASAAELERGDAER